MEVFGIYMSRLLRNDEYEYMTYRVSEAKRAKIRKFIKPEDANRGLIADMLIRTIIRNKFNVGNDQITFATEPYGKPYVAGLPSFHFNLSHSGRWIVCAVDGEPVGIDIERVKPVNFEIAERFFSKEEYRSLMEKEETERLSFFYDLWTIKESFVKQVGKGLSMPLDSFSINISVNHEISLKLEDEYALCYFKQFHLDPDYKMAVCAATGVFSEHVICKSYEELLV